MSSTDGQRDDRARGHSAAGERAQGEAAAGRAAGSDYMRWARTRPHARFDLATSGVPNASAADIGASIDDVDMGRGTEYGHAPLLEAIAARYGAEPENVVTAAGTSMANHLALAALVAPGDEVLLEHPVYDPILAAARYVGASVRFFARRPESHYRVDPDEIARLVTSRTRLVALSNLHNPSSALADDETLARVGEIARAAGARVLVDEVYLDAVGGDSSGDAGDEEDREVSGRDRADGEGDRSAAGAGAAGAGRPRSSFTLGPGFVVTSSLTKVYGLSALRCGWLLADAETARRLWSLNDLFGVTAPYTVERLGARAFAHLDRLGARSRAMLDANRRALFALYDALGGALDAPRFPWGTTSFPRVANGVRRDGASGLAAVLAERYETAVVPGSFFGMDGHIRIGLGCDPAVFREGLARIAEALDRSIG